MLQLIFSHFCDDINFISFIIFFIIKFSGSNAAISAHLQSDENNPDTDIHADTHEKSVPDLELMQNQNQHHRVLNSIQAIR